MKIERLIEQAREELITDIVLSDEFMNRMQENFLPIERLMSYYRCAIMEVETKFRVLNEQFSLQYDRNPIETIKTRVKSFDGILKKVKRKQIPFSLESIEENINDIAGVRVVCSFPEDIYLLAECLLQQDDIRLIEKKDYIKNPKPSGYRSLHLIVEVQFRTIAMDFWASLEHKLRYKKEIPEAEAVQMAEELTECANVIADWDKKMGEIRNRIERYSEEKDESLPAIGLARIINRD